jgi:hypothetical protein
LSYMTPLEVELMTALRLLLSKDGHDRDCPARKSSDHACSIRCARARIALKHAQDELLSKAQGGVVDRTSIKH